MRFIAPAAAMFRGLFVSARAEPSPATGELQLGSAAGERLGRYLIWFACALNLVLYRDEWLVDAPYTNDHVLHLSLVEGAWRALRNGEQPGDFWLPLWGQGFPVARYYQHLPHVLVAVLAAPFPASALPLVYRTCLISALTALPAAAGAAGRTLGLGWLASGCFALCMALLGADRNQHYFLGFQPDKFGSLYGGLFPQLISGLFLLPALGLILQTALRGRRLGLSLLCLSGTWLCHLVQGYALCLFGLVCLVLPDARGQRWLVLRRLAVLYALTFLVIAHQVAPALMEGHLLARSTWEYATYWDGFGRKGLLTPLLSGQALDAAGFPILSILAALGSAWVLTRIAARTPEARAGRYLLLGFAVSLSLALGRPVWGRALALLPLADKLPLHRFFGMLQVTGVGLAALALALALGRALELRARGLRLIAAAALLGCLWPALAASHAAAADTAGFRRSIAEAYAHEGARIAAAMTALRERVRARPARAYAGAMWNWGKYHKIANVPVFTNLPLHGIPSISYLAHTMSLNSDLEALFDPARTDHYDLFNVGYLLAPDREHLPAFARDLGGTPGLLSATVDTRGYFDVVTLEHAFPARDLSSATFLRFAARYVRSDWHSGGHAIRMTYRPEETRGLALLAPTSRLPSRSPATRPGRVVSEWGDGGTYGADVEMDRPGTLLFRMTYHPNFEVRVDGKRVTPFMLAPSHLGVELSKGRQRIDIRYIAGMEQASLLLLALCTLLATFGYERRRV